MFNPLISNIIVCISCSVEDFKYINIIEKEEFESVLKILDNDYEFLYTIVGEFLHYTTSKLEINEKLVDKHLIDSTRKEFKKKLGI